MKEKLKLILDAVPDVLNLSEASRYMELAERYAELSGPDDELYKENSVIANLNVNENSKLN